MVYDVKVSRVQRVLNIARKYLTWIQNSVLEGELSKAEFLLLRKEIEKVIDKKEDNVIFYCLRTTKYLQRISIGTRKEPFVDRWGFL